MDNTNIKSANSEQHVTVSKVEKLIEFLMRKFSPYVTEDIFDFEETDYVFRIYIFGGYRITINKDVDYISTNQRIARIDILDDNWFWGEYFLIDADKENEFRKYVTSDEFADFVCDLIGYKTGIKKLKKIT